MKKTKVIITGLAAALTLTFSSGHAMAAAINTSTPPMLRVSQWAAQECCERRNSENCPYVSDGSDNGYGSRQQGSGNGYGQDTGHQGNGRRLRDGSCRM